MILSEPRQLGPSKQSVRDEESGGVKIPSASSACHLMPRQAWLHYSLKHYHVFERADSSLKCQVGAVLTQMMLRKCGRQMKERKVIVLQSTPF